MAILYLVHPCIKTSSKKQLADSAFQEYVGGITKITVPSEISEKKPVSIDRLYQGKSLSFDAIAVSSDAQQIWVTQMGECAANWKGLAEPSDNDPNKKESFPQADGRILKFHATGKTNDEHTLNEIIGSGLIVTPKQLHVDLKTRSLYWCDREGMRVFRSNLDGSGIACLVQCGLYPQDMADPKRHCVGVAVDQHFLYWTQKGGAGAKEGTLKRCALKLPEGETPATRSDIELLLSDLPEPIDLLIHENRLFWTARGKTEDDGNSLNRADISSDGLKNHKILFKGFKSPIGLAVDLTDQRLFIGDLTGHLWSASLKSCLTENADFSVIATLDPITGLAVAG